MELQFFALVTYATGYDKVDDIIGDADNWGKNEFPEATDVISMYAWIEVVAAFVIRKKSKTNPSHQLNVISTRFTNVSRNFQRYLWTFHGRLLRDIQKNLKMRDVDVRSLIVPIKIV